MDEHSIPKPHINEANTLAEDGILKTRAGDGPQKRAAEPLSARVRSLRLPQGATAGAKARWGTWTLCLLLAAGAAAIGYMLGTRQAKEDVAAAEEDHDGQTGQTGAGARRAGSAGKVVLHSKGYIIPVHTILVSPQVPGKIVKSYIEEGRRITEEDIRAGNDVLAELEKDEYEHAADRAKAMLASAEQRLRETRESRPEEIRQARAAMKEAEAELVQLELQWKRDKELYEKRRVISQQDFEVTDSRYKATSQRVERLKSILEVLESAPREARIRAAEHEVEQAQADLAEAERRLRNCTIRAPIAGTILTKKAEEGNIVNPIAFNVSASLCEMANLAELEVDLKIQERDICHVFKGQKCTLYAEAYPEQTYEGVVSRIMPIADRSQAAISVRVKVLNVPPQEEGVYLKPEMGAVVSFLK